MTHKRESNYLLIKKIKKIEFILASRLSAMLFSFIFVYHLLILLRLIPYEMTWGGRLESAEQMYRFEAASLALNFLFVIVVIAKSRLVSQHKTTRWLNGILWLMVVLFILNTLGNLASLNSLETYIFTPVTFVLAILCWRLAIE